MAWNWKAQQEAWERRTEINVGDRFLWYFGKTHGTSGSLPKKYLSLSDDKCGIGKITMTVCKVYEGKNGHGEYVDYWLSETGEDEKDKFGYFDGIIINGVDAFKMERVS